MKWKSKIVGHEKVRADQLLANPRNHRRHPQEQRDVVKASIEELGFVKSIIVNQRTGYIIDGHERAMTALAHGDGTLVDVESVDLSEEEERLALLILDKTSELAYVDGDAFEELARDVAPGEQAIADMISKWSEEMNVVPKESSTSEVDPDSFEMECKCPKCGFEFDPK